MQCMGTLGCFPWGKRAAIVRRYPAFSPPLYAVFSCFHTTGCEAYSFATDRYGIFNVCTTFVFAIHTKGDQAQTSLHKSWLGGTENVLLTLPCQGTEPRVFGNVVSFYNVKLLCRTLWIWLVQRRPRKIPVTECGRAVPSTRVSSVWATSSANSVKGSGKRGSQIIWSALKELSFLKTYFVQRVREQN